MSNQMHVRMPCWVGPTTVRFLLLDLLGGTNVELEDGPSCTAAPTSCPDLGCFFDLTLPGSPGPRSFFFHADSDQDGRRMLTTRDCPFWRTVMTALLSVVGGTLRNEYHSEPDLIVKSPRPRLNLEDDRAYEWLRRRAKIRALHDLADLWQLE